MPVNKAKKWIITAAIFQIALSLLLLNKVAWYLVIALCLYGLLWLATGLYYKVGKPFYWLSVLFTIPWACLFFIQFGLRIYYWFAYGGELPDGTGSPLAFLIGWAFEIPAVIGTVFLCCMLIYDYMTFKKSEKVLKVSEKLI